MLRFEAEMWKNNLQRNAPTWPVGSMYLNFFNHLVKIFTLKHENLHSLWTKQIKKALEARMQPHY